MTNIAAMQTNAETLALTVASFYDTLKRQNMPETLCQELTAQYQEALLQCVMKLPTPVYYMAPPNKGGEPQ